VHTRYCTNCGEEFRPEILRCSDCGGELEDRYEDEDAEGEPSVPADEVGAPAPEASPEYRTVFRCPDSGALKEAADCLAAAGIGFRGDGSAAGFNLLVPAEDVPRAVAALAGREGGLFASGDEAPPSVGAEGGVCPACGTSVPPGVVECPGCALVVGAEPARCDSCGSVLGPADVQCPVCRAREG
jgi:hypothetical protein